MKRLLVLLSLLACAVLPARAFTNLNFENSIVNGTTGTLVGWTAYVGTNQTSQIGVNFLTLGSANISIVTTNQNGIYGGGPLNGLFSVLLQPGVAGGTSVRSSITQTGMVPLGAQSIQLKALEYKGDSLDTNFFLAFAGQTLSLSMLSNAGTYQLWGADISQFAGQQGELKISSTLTDSDRITVVDDIVFSTQAVPEPSAFALLAAGIVVLSWRRRSVCA